MNIGILTFYNVDNFGANLQALSTYRYLIQLGNNPIFFNYISNEEMRIRNKGLERLQYKTHIKFLEEYIPQQTAFFSTSEELRVLVKEHNIHGFIIGSDAVLQHHPLLARIKKGKRKPFHILHYSPEKMFPNLFWGEGFASKIPTAMMSVSSQNSEYMFIPPWTKRRMSASLANMKYISVRDKWTKDFVADVSKKEYPITPDPVFAYNLNASDTVLTTEQIKEKFGLPDKYVLVCLKKQSVKYELLCQLKDELKKHGLTAVAFTVPKGVMFKHNFDYEIAPPLMPNEWYSVIKNASGYIGSNMHPIVVSLHNAVPCVSIDNWGRTDFWGNKINDNSSKVKHILDEFGLGENHFMIKNQYCEITPEEVVDRILKFPKDHVIMHSIELQHRYEKMMKDIIASLQNSK